MGGGEVEMGRLWNRLVNMVNDHLTKNVFMWDKSLCKHNWSINGFENTFMTNSCVNVKLMHVGLHQQVSTTWNQDIFNVKKLSTYVTFKQEYGTEHYVKVVTNMQHRTALSQFRYGVLPLRFTKADQHFVNTRG